MEIRVKEECQHINHDGFPVDNDNQRWIRRHRWIAISVFAVAALLYSVIPFTLYVPVLLFTIRWYPRPVVLFTNWAIGKWLTISVVSAY